jgi:tRNA-dihydrouridine synthase A
MLDWTDRHERYFLRLLSHHAVLYSEMVTTGALIHGDRQRYLQFNTEEHPIALQLGGSEPSELAQCAQMAEDEGYNEVNINIGCPSQRVQKGSFGACLMAEPELVADCVDAMQQRVNIPITVKHRIGIDNKDSYEELCHFITTIAATGCDTFIIHARKAWLKGLSPKQNRDIPPLDYDLVYQIKRDFPALNIIINGGIKTLAECQQHLESTDGVMLGREVYHNPYLMVEVDQTLYGVNRPILSRKQILQEFMHYVETQRSQDVHLKHMSRHILGLFQGIAGAKAWRRYISENSYKAGAGVEVLEYAANLVDCE